MNSKHFLLMQWNDPKTRASMEGYLPLPFIIGRGRDANLKIKDEAVSRRHVMIAMTDGGLVVRDLSSTNGTLLNGHEVAYGHLNTGDIIAAGPVTFRVSRLGEETILDSAIIIRRSHMEDRTTQVLWEN